MFALTVCNHCNLHAGIIETVASVSALTFVDLDLDPKELAGEKPFPKRFNKKGCSNEAWIVDHWIFMEFTRCTRHELTKCIRMCFIFCNRFTSNELWQVMWPGKLPAHHWWSYLASTNFPNYRLFQQYPVKQIVPMSPTICLLNDVKCSSLPQITMPRSHKFLEIQLTFVDSRQPGRTMYIWPVMLLAEADLLQQAEADLLGS